jgi:hypothetical protein
MTAPIDPNDLPEFPPPPPPGQLPGLARYLVSRYTSNVAIVEQVPVMEVLHKVLFPAGRMFISQGANGKIRLHNRKPVDWALGAAAFPVGDAVLDVDDVSAWIDDLKYFLLIDPHTNDSEIRRVTDANYASSQNSVTLATSHTGTAFTVTGFSGCDGNSTPATASVKVNSFTASTTYTVTLDGTDVAFTPSTSDTVATISSFLAGAFRGHPNVNRKFKIEWDGVDTVTFTGRFGTLTIDSALTLAHAAPESNPVTAPTLTAGAGSLPAGSYQVAYAYRNEHGMTLLSEYRSITLTANQKITVSAISPPGGVTVVWYVTPEANSTKLRFHSENNGSSFEIDAIADLPLLSAPLPPDLNRTGTEVMRIKAVFSDRAETRSGMARANVIRASFDWQLGNREKSVNRIDLQYRESGQDWRLVELRLRNDAHIAKTKKTEPFSINGQAIDTYFQAYRIAAGELAMRRDADFFHKWSATREAHLLEEFDVVAITDSSCGVINFPVSIETIEVDPSTAGLPKLSFTGRKFANTYYDDSVAEIEIPIVTES